jgi:hypothetical protein
VRDVMAPDTPVIEGRAREREIAARREHLAWRFRT